MPDNHTLRALGDRETAMNTNLSGGTMYHQHGFAGLPAKQSLVTVTLLGNHLHVTGAGRHDEVSNLGNESVFAGPSSVPGSLLLK